MTAPETAAWSHGTQKLTARPQLGRARGDCSLMCGLRSAKENTWHWRQRGRRTGEDPDRVPAQHGRRFKMRRLEHMQAKIEKQGGAKKWRRRGGAQDGRRKVIANAQRSAILAKSLVCPEQTILTHVRTTARLLLPSQSPQHNCPAARVRAARVVCLYVVDARQHTSQMWAGKGMHYTRASTTTAAHGS